MTEPPAVSGPFPLTIPDYRLRNDVRAIWEAHCNVTVWADQDADAMEDATGCGATWRWDGHQRGTLTCGPCGTRAVVDRFHGYTIDEFAHVIGTRTDCQARDHVPR
jgi:hypothetical protein